MGVCAALAQSGQSNPRQPSTVLAVRVLSCLAMGAATLTFVVGIYIVKRRLGMDVFPHSNMLPDHTTEAMIRAFTSLFSG